jgi:hypothetical protein
MYGGFRLRSGDIVLKVSGGYIDGVERIVRSLQTQSLLCKVKRKGKFFWIGFQGSNADSFWKTIEPYVLDSFASSTIQGSGGIRTIQGSGGISSDGSQYSDSDYEDGTGRSDRESEE